MKYNDIEALPKEEKRSFLCRSQRLRWPHSCGRKGREGEGRSRLAFCFFSIGICFVSLLWLVGCNQKSDDKNILRVGMDLSYPPFETIDQEGNPAGISVDIARALGEYLNRPVEIENIPFVGLIPSLKANKIDLILSSMTDTPERRNSIAFSDPYISIGLAILVRKGRNIKNINDVDQPGKTVVVRQGTSGHLWAEKHVKNAKVVVVERENAAVLEILRGKADAFVYDQMSVWKNGQEHCDQTEAILIPIQKEYWAIGMRKRDEVLREQVNAFIQEFRAKGGFEALGDKYLRELKKAFSEQGIEFYF